MVVIVGAGPVGLVMAYLLGARNIPVTLLERSEHPPAGSRAIGIMPPSLQILAPLGLAQQCIAAGVPVRRAWVHGAERTSNLGCLSFDHAHDTYPFVLSLPQKTTVEILRASLQQHSSVTLMSPREVTSIVPPPPGSRETPIQVHDSTGATWECNHCIIAGGGKTPLTEELGITRRSRPYRHTFSMADITDTTDSGSDAHLWFTPTGAVESFPLPQGIRRWIIQCQETGQSCRETLEEIVHQRTGITLPRDSRSWQSDFTPAWSRVNKMHHQGNVWIIGDAAHTMSPIGGQGMNTGFADAAHLAALLHRAEHHWSLPVPQADADFFHRVRTRAARVATARAALGMGVGTMTGTIGSAWRNKLIAWGLNSPLHQNLARHFAMITIPGTVSGGEEFASSHP